MGRRSTTEAFAGEANLLNSDRRPLVRITRLSAKSLYNLARHLRGEAPIRDAESLFNRER